MSKSQFRTIARSLGLVAFGAALWFTTAAPMFTS